MTELEALLEAFRSATGCDVAVWAERDGERPALEAAAPQRDGRTAWRPTLRDGPPTSIETPDGHVLVCRVPGPRHAWIVLGPTLAATHPPERYSDVLAIIVGQYLQSSLEVEHAANELAERYEEINLLYTITEILGRSVALEETAATILKEISETVGARRGSILVHDRVTDTLTTVAALGIPPMEVPPIALNDECSVSAQVFRELRVTTAEDGEGECPAESLFRRGRMLSVPIMWTAPGGQSEPLGVLNLSDRASGQPFSAGDQKLMAAIATQIGTAIQNARLVRVSMNQQRLVRELELAHDLQMKLLPRSEVALPEAVVAARVVPAESVGGDFYNLFRLGGNRTGVMIGDVSSHGYRAALIMALALSASAIHAQTSNDPAETLGALLSTLRDELTTTEMFISAFYAVIDRDRSELRYANAGHPYAYVIGADGSVERLPADAPPLGMVDDPPRGVTRPWTPGSDVLLLFTDGVSDARNRFGVRLGEQPVTDVVRNYRDQPPDIILERLLAELSEHTGDTLQRDDLTFVILRS